MFTLALARAQAIRLNPSKEITTKIIQHLFDLGEKLKIQKCTKK